MKLRLHGTPSECAAAADRLRRTPGLHVLDESRLYPDRSGELVRVYLTVDLDPTSHDQPSQPAGGGEGEGASGERLRGVLDRPPPGLPVAGRGGRRLRRR